ncbi:MAG: SDR family NAD(P)-dependent oxidoreductase [Rikenellaceae bacterium]
MASIFKKAKIALQVFVPQRKKADPKLALTDKEKDLRGKTILFTGGTDGIGRCAVEMLCDMGADVVLLARSRAKGEAVIQAVNAKGKGRATFEICDLSSMDSVRSCAESILAKYSKINILVNCAGVNMLGVIKFTADNIETTWAVNYFAPVLLTRLLQPAITERIINLTTDTLFIDSIDYGYISTHSDFNTKAPYFDSKLALNMFTIELAEELKHRGITVNAMLPGYIKSNLLRDLKGAAKIMQTMMNIMASPTEVGADRIVRLVAAERFGKETGLYMAEDKIEPFHPKALNTESRERIKAATDRFLNRWVK